VSDTPPTDALPASHAERKAADHTSVKSDLAAAAANIAFQDREAARQILSRVRAHLSPELAAAVPALLSEAPDPDSALISFERLVSEPSGEMQRLLNQHHVLAHYAIVVFGHSRFLGETLIQNPDLLQTFLRERNLDHSFSREEFHESLARFRSRSFENEVSLLLAHFKRREYVRIMLRDVLRLAPLAETTAEISALSDVLIEEALRDSENWVQRRYEAPRHFDPEGRLVDTPFTILSLGKLGGNELNYSSDVDLLYIFGDGEEPPGTRISNREYFIRLAQHVTEVLSRVTREGPVFRIDMRLRPQGGEGELAISLSHALKYYAHSAQDWERQALIKLRHSAGDERLAREFIRGVQAYVYSGAGEEAGGAAPPAAKRLNFAAIATSLASRERMRTRHRSRLQHTDQSVDVKLDRGGIRDIEFLVQCLQRVYGGAEPWLRSGGTLFSLQKLHDKRHISGKEFHELTSAYEFLRHLEHRLQLRQGQQTHHLPAAPADLQILQRSLEGYASGDDRLGDVTVAVRRRMAAVAEIYHRIIHQQSRRRHELAEAEFELRSLAESGSIEQSHQQMLERLAADSPALFEITRRRELGSQTRRNLFRFLSSAFTSSERYAALVRNPHTMERALAIFESSDYLTEILVRHPEEISTLAETGMTESRVGTECLFESALGGSWPGSDPVFSYLANSSASYGEKLSLLRQHYRHRIFALGARDISELREVHESLAATTAAAEGAISAAFVIAEPPDGLAVLALGRLGTGEFDVLSDADLLFVFEEGKDRVALSKSAEQIMQTLAAYTRDGSVFPIDTRLRPRGNEGELLVTPAQLQAYFEQEAQPWEALTYTKLRFLIGSQEVGLRAKAATKVLFHRFAADRGFLPAVQEMRQKLENADPGEKSFKTSAGGMYDIDFLVGYLLVQHAVKEKGGTIRERLWRCVAAGVLEKSDAATLTHAAELFRTVEHVVRLVVGRARKWLPATEHARQVTERLSTQILRRTFSRGLEQELTETCGAVRDIYRRMLS
jgi:[glutamine synthetase] adenylyltransferase / [glutamine synthetase]-adenylyl-L-tyrosine phosphorylase